ncbi:putative tyrosyl-DNA phosphodiesterase [Frankliniella fusca]|uniref:Tyrosyl-DNA phosphodiesterase n=1 Tax=Frankliniella fusca TaxID=407009 RepID=A0AAE1LC09_9NEOP|nr:putative tyrosyl-DNA phosphodiesterase [Frankliniella fusca]
MEMGSCFVLSCNRLLAAASKSRSVKRNVKLYEISAKDLHVSKQTRSPFKMAFNRPGKRLSDGAENLSSVKKRHQECQFGKKCFRKNPSHFVEFDHLHLNEIVLRWHDEKSLPPDLDPELKRTAPSIVLEQLKIVRSLQCAVINKDSEQPNLVHSSLHTSSASDDLKPTQRQRPTDVSKGSSSKTTGSFDDSSEEGERSGNNSSSLVKMMKEATKHHGDVQAKLDASAPYFFFLTAITDCRETHQEPLTITFTELLDPGLGELQSSLQINFMVELGWLLAQYFYTGNRYKPLTLLYGVEDDDLREGKKLPNNVTAVKVKPPTAFGHHHTKMSVLAYKDSSIRVVVSTANLVESDWENRTQGLWVSPKLPPLPPGADTLAGESPTQFKADLLRYLSAYRLPQLQEWIGRVQRADFTAIRVCLVASVPGTHFGPDFTLWGQSRLNSLLKSHVIDPKQPLVPWKRWPIVGQFSSIGSLGPDPNSWVCGELRASMSAPSKPLEEPPIKLIYPSLANVKGSHDGLLGGACLPYQKKVHEKQTWLRNYLFQWQSNGRFRTRAMPHIKSYARMSPCCSYLSWFLLTSANLSKAAWGTETKSTLPGRGLRILSYEAGVLFLPNFLVEDNVFKLENTRTSKKEKIQCGTGKCEDYAPFPLHYDLPLQPYNSEDTPFFYDIFKDS